MPELIPLDKIQPNPYQPREREDPETVAKIAQSILDQGLLQVPVGRRVNGHIELAFGHTRLAAYKKLAWPTMPVDIRELSDLQMFELSVSENLARKDLTPIEEAKAMRRYKDEFSKTSAEIGQLFGLSDSTVRNKMRLADLPEEEQKALLDGRLLEGAARELLTLHDLPADILQKAEGNWSWHDEGKPSWIVREACKGSSAEWVSDQIDKICKQYTNSLSEAPWKHEQVFDDPYYSQMILGPCKGCSHRITRKGTPYCTRKECYSAKRISWEREYLRKASQACGIPVLEVNVENPTGLDSYDDPGGKIKTSKCENLRIRYSSFEYNEAPDGFPHAGIVCVKQNGSCSCLKGLQAIKSKVGYGRMTIAEREEKIQEAAATLTPDQLAEQAKAARVVKRTSMSQVDNIRQRAEQRVLGELLAGRTAGWKIVLEALSWTAVEKLNKGDQRDDPETILAKIAEQVIAKMMPDSYSLGNTSDPAGRVLDNLNEHFSDCGLARMTRMNLE